MKICVVHKTNRSIVFSDKYLLAENFTLVGDVIYTPSAFFLDFKNAYDAIVIDLITEKQSVSDYEMIKKIRAHNTSVPVLLLLSSDVKSQYREAMLDLGVDGVVQAPFLPEEAFIRIKKLVEKKGNLLFSGTKIITSSLHVDIRKHSVTTGLGEVHLTKTEYGILFHLLMHKNRIVSSSSLLSCLDQSVQKPSSALNIHVLHLRKKLKNLLYIKTVPHYGFLVTDSQLQC